jgi:hypothetical protein
MHTLVCKRFYFDLLPFKIDTCCKFLEPYTPRIYVNMSALHVAVFCIQVVKGRYFFAATATRVTQLREENDSDITIILYINMTLETELLSRTISNYYYSIITPFLSRRPE